MLHIFPQLWFNLCIFAKVIDQVGKCYWKDGNKNKQILHSSHFCRTKDCFCINLLSFVLCSCYVLIAFLLLVWGSYSTHTVGLLQVYCTWKALTLLTESKKTFFFAYFISEYKEWKDVCKGRNNHILSSYKKLWQCQNHLQQIETNRIMNFINSIL